MWKVLTVERIFYINCQKLFVVEYILSFRWLNGCADCSIFCSAIKLSCKLTLMVLNTSFEKKNKSKIG